MDDTIRALSEVARLRAEVERLNKEIQALQMDPRYDEQHNAGAIEAGELLCNVLRNGTRPALSPSPLSEAVAEALRLRERLARLEEAPHESPP